jgi:hypothetical protein
MLIDLKLVPSSAELRKTRLEKRPNCYFCFHSSRPFSVFNSSTILSFRFPGRVSPIDVCAIPGKPARYILIEQLYATSRFSMISDKECCRRIRYALKSRTAYQATLRPHDKHELVLTSLEPVSSKDRRRYIWICSDQFPIYLCRYRKDYQNYGQISLRLRWCTLNSRPLELFAPSYSYLILQPCSSSNPP